MTKRIFSGREYDWEDCNYYLRIQVDGQQVFEWTVDTYNPYFGTQTLYLHWLGEEVIYIYHEKHRIYGVTAALDGIRHQIDIGQDASQMSVDENIVTILPLQRAYAGFFDQYRLPDWEKLDPLPEAKAREMRLLK